MRLENPDRERVPYCEPQFEAQLPGCRPSSPCHTTRESDTKRIMHMAVAVRGKRINRGREYENLDRLGGTHIREGQAEPGDRVNRI